MRRLTEASIVVLVVGLVAVACWAVFGGALSHMHSGEDTTDMAAIASRIATQIEVSMACNTGNVSSLQSSTYTMNGATVTASVSGGVLHLQVKKGNRTFPVDRPIYTTCNSSGATITANGAQ